MLQFGQMIANSLAVVTVGVELMVVGASYARNLPDPIVQVAQADDALPAWIDPETTGAITPKADSTPARLENSQPELRAESTAWVDPPRRSRAGDPSAAAIDQTMELRLPRP